MSYKALKTSGFAVGNAMISNEMREEGYFGTICTSVVPSNGAKHQFVDLHCTKEQLENLVQSINNLLAEVSEQVKV